MDAVEARIQAIGKSATLAINERVASLREQGKKIYSFGLGQSPFPVPDCIVKELQKYAHKKDYLPVQGLPQLREAVAAFHHRKDNITFSKSNILIGPGSKELIFLLQLVFDGDIIIPTPSWVSYHPQSIIANKKVITLETHYDDNWQINLQLLEKICKQPTTHNHNKLLILNYPCNPTGTTYDLDSLKGLVEVARKNRVIILADEIYSVLQHEGQASSIAQLYPDGTILSSGLSKWCGAGGWRLGTLAFPDELKALKDAVIAVASETFTSVSAPIQFASVLAFEGNNEIDLYIHRSREILRVLGSWIADKLRKNDIETRDLAGGFYVFPRFIHHRELLAARKIHTDKALYEALINEAGVATLPGSSFGMKESELILRMSYVDFDGAAALTALENGHKPDLLFLQQYCPSVVDGIESLIRWLR